MKYEVFSGDVMIGWSELEAGDPPMGVAFGVFHPSDSYRAREAQGLRVRPEGCAFFEPVAGVHIEDYSADLGADGMEISVLGIDGDTYRRFFPMHVKAYEDQF
jgi:hypothetical protein